MSIISNMPNAEYHAYPAISKSGLDLIARSPAHYRYAAPRSSTRAMEIGTALHMAILEPSLFAETYIVVDCEDRRAAVYKQAAASVGGHRALTRAEHDELVGMQQAAWANPDASALLTAADTELSFITTDPVTGVPVKCRFDALAGVHALDLKKTQDSRAEAFAKSIVNYRYHVQAAFYSDVFEWETGEKLAAFGFLTVEESAPHGVGFWIPSDRAMEEGRRLYRRDLNAYALALEKDEWPCLSGAPEIIELPEWAYKGEIE